MVMSIMSMITTATRRTDFKDNEAAQEAALVLCQRFSRFFCRLGVKGCPLQPACPGRVTSRQRTSPR